MEKLVCLCDVEEGKECVVSEIGDIEIKKAKRLIELGFVKGTKIVVLKKTKQVCLVGVRGFCLGLDVSLAKNILCWAV